MATELEISKAQNFAPELTQESVHVWPCLLAAHQHRLPEFEASFSPDERARASAFRFQKDRDAFMIARGLLRVLLGRYLREDPGRIRFRCNAFGKPRLDESYRAEHLRFNLAHSHGAAVIAIAMDREVTVDVEFMRADFVIEDPQLFSPTELQELRSLSGDEKVRCFFGHWTRKEAVLKAMGVGFRAPPGILQEPEVQRRWSVINMSLFPGYAAALAVEGNGFNIVFPC